MSEENDHVRNESEVKYNRLLAHIKKNAQCTICKELPAPDDLYQCTMGHLLCELCIVELLIKQPLENKFATCPNCLEQINFAEISYNLAIRDTIWELPCKCKQCDGLFIRKQLELHMKEKCVERPSQCRYRCIGCPWIGPFNQRPEHEGSCNYPKMSAINIVKSIHKLNKCENLKYRQANKIYKSLSWERIFTIDVPLAYNFSNATKQISFTSSRFSAFEETWYLYLRINDCLDNVKRGGIQYIDYRLERTTTNKRCTFKLQFYVTSCPKGRRNIITCVHKQTFTPEILTTDYKILDINDSKQRNLLLVQQEIWLRLYMFFKLC